MSLSSFIVVCRSFRTSRLLTAFQELSGLQQNVHHLLLGPRRSLLVTSKGCLHFFFTVSQCSVCFSACSSVMLKNTSYLQRRCSHSFLCKNLFHPESSSQVMTENLFTSCCYPVILKNGTGTWHPIVLQINSPEVICSPASCC